MVCANVIKNLSEYIDGVLDGETMSAIQNHLRNCEACRKEYVSLNDIVRDLNSMETIRAPEDLLERVKERIERDSVFWKIRQVLFSPARFKIPMELTALTATALIIFMIFYGVKPETRVEKALPGTGEKRVAAAIGKDSGLYPQEKGPIELELVLGSGERTRALPPKKVVPVLSGRRHQGREKPELGPGSRLPGLSPELDRFFDDVNRSFEDSIESAKDHKDVISDLNKIISLAKGRLLATEYKTGTDIPEYVTLELPRDGYPMFLNNIGRMGSFRTPAPPLSPEYKDVVRLRIRIIEPE